MDGPKKVAIGCQGGGMHAAFEVGVLTEILKDIRDKKRIELVGLSGTSAGALCALMVWYGLAPKPGSPGSADEAIEKLNDFWDDFVAEHRRRDGTEFSYLRRILGGRERDSGAWGKCANFRSQSVRRALQGVRCRPAESRQYASNILIWRRCSRKHVRISITSSGKNKRHAC